MNAYPAKTAERDAWILSRRPAREIRDPYLPYQYFVEEERTDRGQSNRLPPSFSPIENARSAV